ncbi:peptidase M24, structural domain-containing protein [Lentinula aciculospora]|uniref:Peptidase M24, structural domain-containing protein n=1 Tax=Lentinula aciculospora TaxID=153920 RepID=A0A9W8ZUZ8_9AGAR|nr:peptidase M24, structural domain-containing protein [Lentinula aciculospora]
MIFFGLSRGTITVLRESYRLRAFATSSPKIMTVHTAERLAKLREFMKKPQHNIDVYVVPSEDQHGSEYIASCDERRAWISGFNGSAGCAIITLDRALMFTDGRYFLQASQQMDKNWELMKQGLPGVPTWQDYLTNHLPASSRIGIDPTLITENDTKSLSGSRNAPKSESPDMKTLVPITTNLIDLTWASDRPPRPKNAIMPLVEKYAGESVTSKLDRLASTVALNTPNPRALVLTALDDIAWLFNLRGSDIAYNPVFFSYAVVHFHPSDGSDSSRKPNAVIFLQRDAIEQDVDLKSVLGYQVDIRPYEDIWTYLKDLGSQFRSTSAEKSQEKLVLIPDKASLAIVQAIGEDISNVVPSPITILKAIKNSVELEGFRQSHIRDGIALSRYFSWLEEKLSEDGHDITEWEGAEQLEKFRSELPLFKGLSFDTISSTGPNGAIIHYSPDPKDCAVIKRDQIYLCDSGAQFLDGTTDVTRTWHFGTPTDEEKRTATRVLQGHIAIDSAIFPNGTTGVFDSWARKALWSDGLGINIHRHGTGHGVGHYLNVHEGPHGIGTRITSNASPLKAGMIVTNEPGYYADGKYGVRIENVLIIKEVATPWNFGDKGFLGFECVTMCPIQTKLVNQNLISVDEKEWLNKYNRIVWEKISPFLMNDERALKWLERECQAI